jgi:hypothetical protein
MANSSTMKKEGHRWRTYRLCSKFQEFSQFHIFHTKQKKKINNNNNNNNNKIKGKINGNNKMEIKNKMKNRMILTSHAERRERRKKN